MKHLLLVLVLALTVTACGSKNKSNENTSSTEQTISIDPNQTTVIYFHSNHRCATCMAVENVSKEAADRYKSKIPFYSVDMTLEKNKALMEQYKIGVQSLIIVKNDQKLNLTSEAFMYARSKPEKVISKVQSSIESLD